jgi:lipopolysaccharide transport system ATP-binding protein
MSDVAIRVENLSKLYRIGSNGERHDTLRDALVAALRRNGDRRAERAKDAEFWALRDVSFEVKRGEVVGVIGRNGAGKSTLLKILSRITEPTSGRAEIHGRVGSLLEVGTGFHPELTGRENIYLNGAILGMKRAEIARRFDEIVAFAEIDRFLDTPVKRYSSGMYVRLAFAVAAHLEPEILLVDEVLAVGDAAFQKKCLGKMGDVAGEGRTVVFVSHNMRAIRELTYRTVMFSDGELQFDGATDDAFSRYVQLSKVFGSIAEYREKGGERAGVVAVRANGATPPTDLYMGDGIQLGIKFHTEYAMENPCVTLIIRDRLGYNVATLCSLDSACPINFSEGDNWVDVLITPIVLTPGWYTLDIALNPSFTSQALDVIRGVPLCSVHLGKKHRYGSLDQPNRTWGAIHIDGVLWTVKDDGQPEE